jgi:hypothetical protein
MAAAPTMIPRRFVLVIDRAFDVAAATFIRVSSDVGRTHDACVRLPSCATLT